MGAHGLGQCLYHGMLARRALVNFRDRLAPPGQTDFAQQRFRDDGAGLGDLLVEGIEREQRLAPVGWREQAGEEPFRIIPPHLKGAIGQGGLGHDSFR